MAERILVVDPDPGTRAALVAVLVAASYDTSDARDLVSALARLNAATVDLLITVVRPGVFNGLPIVVRGCADNPRMAALVVHDSPDAVPTPAAGPRPIGAPLHMARSIGSSEELLRKVAEALAGRERRRWSRTMLQAPLTIHTMNGRARVLDVSYGGVRLEFPSPQGTLPTRLHLELPTMGLLVDARRVWNQGRGGAVRCGAELQANTLKRALRWRRLVDSLRTAGSSTPTPRWEG